MKSICFSTFLRATKAACLGIGLMFLAAAESVKGAAPLILEEPIVVPDSKGGFDYLQVDDETHLWVVDTKSEKVVASIDIPAGPEYVIYDPTTDRVFQNIKSNDSLLAIDPANNTIKERWNTAPAKKPHGLALDTSTRRLF